MGSTGAGVTSLTDASLICGTNYYYRVFAYNSGGQTGYSNILMAGTRACNPVLASPPAVIPHGIKLTWTDSSKNQTGYQVDMLPPGSRNWVLAATFGPHASDYTVSPALCGETRSYRVTSLDVDGASAASNIANAATICPPAAPSNFAVHTDSLGRLVMSWSDNSNNEDGFNIYWSDLGSDNWQLLTQAGAGATGKVLAAPPAMNAHYYRVPHTMPAENQPAAAWPQSSGCSPRSSGGRVPRFGHGR